MTSLSTGAFFFLRLVRFERWNWSLRRASAACVTWKSITTNLKVRKKKNGGQGFLRTSDLDTRAFV